MIVKVLKNPEQLGMKAAAYAAQMIKDSITEKGKARIVLSTGASQFETLKHLVKSDVDWSKVEMFHLDEYVNLPDNHPASFRKYLKERFIYLVDLGKAHLINGEADVKQTMKELTREIREEPIDLGLIGIGENAHIAFNDPPADFDTKEAYIIANLDEACKQQQVGEGWFTSTHEVPNQAISMTVYQILQCKAIISCVPNERKAKAIKQTLESGKTNLIPATALKNHAQCTLFLDEGSASMSDENLLRKYR